MNENIEIQDTLQTDLQNDSFISGVSDNPVYTDSDAPGYVLSFGNDSGTSDAGITADSEPGNLATSGEFTASSDTLSVSSGDVVSADNVYISLSDLQTYQASTVENQTGNAVDLASIEEKIDTLNFNISALLFFVIFTWCYERTKNAVRSFNGVGLK